MGIRSLIALLAVLTLLPSIPAHAQRRALTVDAATNGIDAIFTSPTRQQFGHVLESAAGTPGACENVLRITNLAGFQTDDNYYSTVAVTDPNNQSQATFGYGNDSTSLLPWRRNGFIEEWTGSLGTAPLPGFVHVQTSAAGSFIRQQILSDGTNPGDQLFFNGRTFNANDGQQLRLATDGTVTIGNASTGALLSIGGRIGATTTASGNWDSTLAFNGPISSPAISTKPGLYHRAGVGLGVFADAQISFEVNGVSALSEAARFNASGNLGIANTNPQSALTVGAIGTVKEISVGMSSSFARLRERDSANTVGLSTNMNDSGAVDNASLPSWKAELGAGLDDFSVQRAPAGSGSWVSMLTVTSSGVVQMAPLTVSALPSASSNAGAIAFVTDATSWSANTAPTGGGSTKVMVFSDGTNWLMK